MRYYPVFLDLRNRHCIVIGGGKVAERKIRSLIEAEATVTVISPDITEEIEGLCRSGRIRHISRSYQKGDLKDAFLVIAATSDKDVNREIFEEASGKPLNVVDMPDLCTFIVPSVIRRGNLTVAISTSGVSPALSRSLRLDLQDCIPEEIGEFLDFLGALRRRIKGREGSEEILREVGSQRILRTLVLSGVEEAKEEVKRILAERGLEGLVDGYL